MNLYEKKSELEKVCTKKVYKTKNKVLSLAGFEPTPYTTVTATTSG